jgi:hypothetical protein
MDILKVPLLLAKPKSKRSEESQHLTSSPYKQSLEDEIVQKKANLAQKKRKTKSSGNQKKPRNLHPDIKKQLKLTLMMQNVQSVVNFGQSQCLARIG